MQEEHRNWLMSQIESLVKNPELANFGIQTCRCDLEIIVTVAEEDRSAFTPEVLETLKNELSVRTGVTAPVIYLEGNEPEWLAKGANI